MRHFSLLLLSLVVLALLSGNAWAQVGGMSFSQSLGTYTAITGGTVHTTSNTWDDTPNYTAIPIGFTFNFDGVDYTTVTISMNGFITFGATAPGTTNYTPLSSTTAYTGAVSGFGRDLQGVVGLGEIRSESSGGVFTVQWAHARRYNGSTVNTEDFSFQIKLHQTSNTIELVYGSFTDAQTASNTNVPQVGLRGATNADYNNREVLSTGDWSASTAGAANTATCYYNQATPAVKPVSGQTYTWQLLPQTYDSSTVTQNTAAVSQGALNAQIIGVEVAMSGGASPLSVTSFTFNTTGTTNAANILNARLFYTGSSATFSTAEQFGSTVASPSGTFTITGTRTLGGVNNHFWLAYDVAAGATVGNLLDAQCTSLIVDGITRTPTVTAPAGSRVVQAALAGVYTIDPGGSGGTNYTTFTAAVADLNLLGTSGSVTFNVKAGAVFTGAIAITATGIVSRPIIFQRSGVGANPILEETGTASTTEAIVTLTGSDYITFDGIDLRPTSGSTAMEWGYYFVGTATDGCQNNTVKNCAITLDRANTGSRGVYLSSLATGASGANSNNRFYNNTVRNAYAGYWLAGVLAAPDDGNEIGISGGVSTIRLLGGGSTSSYGVYYGYQTTCKIFSTTIDSISTTSGTIYGIYNSGGAPNTVEVSNNTVMNLATSTGTIYGIYGGSSGTTYIVHGNEISGLTSSGSTIYGMYHGGGTMISMYANRVHDLSYSGASTSLIYGMYTAGGTTHNIYNNFVYDLRSPGGTSTSGSVNGIYISSGTNINLYYNTVLLNYVSTAASNQNTAVYVSATPSAVDMRNNVFVDVCDMTTGTRAVAFRKGSTALTNMASATDNNLYYAGTPGPKNLIFYDGTNADTTLVAYKVRMGTRDQSAVTENPPFLSTVAPYNLHMNTAIATQVESGGTPVTTPIAVTDDIDGNTRNVGTPDVGADEFAGLGLDVTPPSMTYVPLTGTAVTTARTLITSITDATGVPTSGGGLPVLYWKVNSGSWSAATAVHGAGSQYSFTFGGGVIVGDTVSYYIVARDIAGTPHIGSSPGGASGFTYDPPAASTPPPAPNSYTILLLVSSFPYAEDFEDSPAPESNGAGWTAGIVSGTVNNWIRGTPNKRFIYHAHGGLKAYFTADSLYDNNHNAFIQAPIFDFSSMAADPVVEFWQNLFMEVSFDAGILEYSYDAGTTWRRADSTLGTGPNFNTANSTAWYNNSSTSGPTPPPKWSDTSYTKYSTNVDSGWIHSSTTLPGAAGRPDVRVRWRFATDGSVVRDGGWAIDDVNIHQGTGAVSIGVSIAPGWNMISNPVTTSADSVRQLFSTSSFNYAFSFAGAGGYQQRYRLLNTVGYWGKFPGATTATISGTSRATDSIAVSTGWNMVGSISTAVDTSTITSVPPGIRSSTAWFGYAAGYAPAQFITPGLAYWVKASAPGKFVFSSGPVPEKAAGQKTTIADLNTVTITDSRGGSQTLYFGVDANGSLTGLDYEMPPAPPAGGLDARFTDGERGVLLRTVSPNVPGAEFPISVQTDAWPLTISWKVQSSEAGMSYQLSDGIGGAAFTTIPMRGEGEARIARNGLSRIVLQAGNTGVIPREFALLQNYPNPFNPSTTITFALPSAAGVNVEVFNVLGQRIATLVNNEQRKAGFHTVEWNGTGTEGLTVGSGVYFVRFSANGGAGIVFTDVRKMMLMK
jgi:hypothetical protein